MMPLRFLRRLRFAAGFVGRVIHVEPSTGEVFRIAPGTAWALAVGQYPNPRQEAEARRQVDDAIAWGRAMRRRIEAERGDEGR